MEGSGIIRFDKWGGENGIEKFITEQTGCKPFSGAGINYRAAKNLTILRSVDGTTYYDDNLKDPNCPYYTLFGQEGDQDAGEKHFNQPLLDKTKTHNIYLYRLAKECKKTVYYWYGKYKIKRVFDKQHLDINGKMRKIIKIELERSD